MFGLFNDTVKYGFNFKVKVKFKVNTKNSEKSAYCIAFFCYCIKFNLNGKNFLKQSKLECIGFK